MIPGPFHGVLRIAYGNPLLFGAQILRLGELEGASAQPSARVSVGSGWSYRSRSPKYQQRSCRIQAAG